MKPIGYSPYAALAATLALAACVPQPKTTPPVPAPTPSPTAAPAPAPTYDSWMDAPQTPGDWSYRTQAGGGLASFGDTASGARFTMRCDQANRTVVLLRAGEANGATRMVVRTESQTRTLAANPANATLPGVESRLAASDRLLDAMALSKGRFAIEVPGTSTLFLPSWAEVTRVIEDCR